MQAAERIEFSYGLLEFDLSVDSLQNYAETGTVDSDLDFYFHFLSSTAEAELQGVLHLSHDMSPWEVSQLLYSGIGEESLQNIGALVQTESQQNGFHALRSAIIQSSADPEGLSVLGVLQHFPSESIHINVAQALDLAHAISEFADLSKDTLAAIHAESESAAASTPVDLTALPPCRNKVRFSSQNKLWIYGMRSAIAPSQRISMYLPLMAIYPHLFLWWSILTAMVKHGQLHRLIWNC